MLTPAGLGLLATTAVFIISVRWDPTTHPGPIFCPFRRMTGYDCPGCGLSRAFCAIGKGEVSQAVHFHPLSPLVFALFVVWWLHSLLKLLGRDEWAAKLVWPFTQRPFFVAVVVVFLVRWVLHLWLGW